MRHPIFDVVRRNGIGLWLGLIGVGFAVMLKDGGWHVRVKHPAVRERVAANLNPSPSDDWCSIVHPTGERP